MVRHYRLAIYQKGANMANAKNKTTTKTKNTKKVANKPTDQQVAAQQAQADLLVAMQAAHASRKPAGQGSRHGRHLKARMPNRNTVVKLATALLAAVAGTAGNVTPNGDRLILRGYQTKIGDQVVGADPWVALYKTWLHNQHGWRVDQTCQRSANALGFTGRLYNASTDQRHVILAPLDPVAFSKDPAGYVQANLATLIGTL